MYWRRLKLSIIAGTAILLCLVAAMAVQLLQRGETATLQTARTSIERSARAVENSLNRQLLQVHGALASLPTLFSATDASDPEVAGKLLRGLNFQTLAYRDLLLVDANGTVIATARPSRAKLPLPFAFAAVAHTPTKLIGPVRNDATGEWSAYVARALPGDAGLTAIADVPLRTLMELLAETGLDPAMRVYLERPDGHLIASIPHDEVGIAEKRSSALGGNPADGVSRILRTEDGRPDRIVVGRTPLFDDTRLALAIDVEDALRGWAINRDWIIGAAVASVVIVVAFALVLLLALRQRERAEAARNRAASVLVNAIDAMSDGFAMWDEEDRLVTCNERYVEMSPVSAAMLKPGVRYRDVVAAEVAAGQHATDGEPEEKVVARIVAQHREGAGSWERRLPDGRWVLKKERRTADGGIVGIRTDITALKAMLTELAEANTRANEATAEAQRQNAALSEREAHIRYLAHHDDLTGLPNRIQFRQQIEEALGDAARGMSWSLLLYLDLDRFKDVNDALGHPIGDALLRMVADRLRQMAPEDALVARLGSDEFAMLCRSTGDPAEVERLSHSLLDRLGAPYSIHGHAVTISASIGVAVAAGNEPGVDELLKQADVALQEAKARGRNNYCRFAPEMEAELRERLELQADLRRALDEHQFELAYQPIYEFAGGRLSGFEALLRWRHPTRGMVSPGVFVPIAEDAGLIVDIGRWVLGQACSDLRRLPDGLRMAVNLSAVEFALGNIVASVTRAIHDHQIEPGRLELEITETALFSEDHRNLNALRLLRAAGARVALDDFGTGYSSLSHLHTFPLDKVKIDRSFVQDMTERADSAAIVEAVAALARRLGKTTTAEGIETEEQYEAARRAGCTEAQGYYLGVPKPFAEALALATSSVPPLIPA